jgi:hypothetical protein
MGLLLFINKHSGQDLARNVWYILNEEYCVVRFRYWALSAPAPSVEFLFYS